MHAPNHTTLPQRPQERSAGLRVEHASGFACSARLANTHKSRIIRRIDKTKQLTKTVETAIGRFVVNPNRDQHIYRHLTASGAHQRGDIAMLRSILRAGDRVIDIGAHIGTMTVPLARHVGPGGAVVAIDPNPATCALLTENICANGLTDRATIVQIGVGSKHDNFFLHQPDYNSGGSYLDRTELSGLAVSVVPLDDILFPPDAPHVCPTLIKIDAEGFEYDVLAGAQKTLTHCTPTIFFEFNPRRLGERGYGSKHIALLLQHHCYRFYKNLMPSDCADDRFEIGRLFSLRQVRGLCDVLAIPPAYQNRIGKVRGSFETLATQVRVRIARGLR